MNNGYGGAYFRRVVANFLPHPSPLGTIKSCGRLYCEDWFRDCNRCYLRRPDPYSDTPVSVGHCWEWPVCGSCSNGQTARCPHFSRPWMMDSEVGLIRDKISGQIIRVV